MKKEKNIPVLQQVMARQNEYETHLWKLQQIQAQRQRSLARKSFMEKTVLIEHIRNQKHANFMQKLTRESHRINHENLRLVDKLHRAPPAVPPRHGRPSSLNSLSYALNRTRQKEIARENSRIFHKLNRSCPFVNTQKISEDYERTRRIGDRLRKYNDDCQLKTKKYMRSSTLSAGSSKRMPAPAPVSTAKPRTRPKAATFYNKEDILRNKIEHRGVPSAKVLLNAEARNAPSEQKYYDFFNTQVMANPERS